MRKTKIVCTIGPASNSVETILEMMEAGMDVARFNLSHGSLEEHDAKIGMVREAGEKCGKPAVIMLDTKGPEIRLGAFEGGSAFLHDGDEFVLCTETVPGNAERVQVSYEGIARDLKSGDQVLVDDGNIVLEVLDVKSTQVICKVCSGGTVSDRKKVNLPGVSVSFPFLSPKDIRDIKFSVDIGADFIAASFIRTAEDVLKVKRLIEQNGGNSHVIAKIESRQGLDNLSEILEVADGLMVARGDLGVEIPLEEVPLVQKDMIRQARRLGKPVITATQMLESMTSRPRPTRAEASDVANAIFDGTDAVMLSGETAAGRYPVETIKMMDRIARTSEKALTWVHTAQDADAPTATITNAIGYATWATARDLRASAIITPTESGYTARMVAKYRPLCSIVAATPYEDVCRKLALLWGVHPVMVENTSDTDEMIELSVNASIRAGTVSKGNLVVITAGVPSGVSGTTNLLKIHTV